MLNLILLLKLYWQIIQAIKRQPETIGIVSDKEILFDNPLVARAWHYQVSGDAENTNQFMRNSVWGNTCWHESINYFQTVHYLYRWDMHILSNQFAILTQHTTQVLRIILWCGPCNYQQRKYSNRCCQYKNLRFV